MQTTIINDLERDYIDNDKLLGFIEFMFERMNIDKELELNILLSDDKKITQLNKQFKGKDEPTNILSFYGYDGEIFGDIIISIDTLEREAKEQEKDVFDYLLFLLSHGFLHLAGYTHETMEKYNDMIDEQNDLIKEWKHEIQS